MIRRRGTSCLLNSSARANLMGQRSPGLLISETERAIRGQT